jgi:hypothetical protein
MSHTSRRRALAAAATALLALAPSALAAHRAPQPGPPNSRSAVAAQAGALTGTHAQTPSDIDRAWDANVGAYTPGASPAVSYPSGGAYTPGAIPAVSYPSGTTTRAVNDPASGGVNPTTIGLGIAGSLLAIAGVVGLARRSRRSRRIRTFAPDQMWENERTKA